MKDSLNIGAILVKDQKDFLDNIMPLFAKATCIKVGVPHEKEHEVEFAYAGHDFHLFHMPLAEDFWFYIDEMYVDSLEALDIAIKHGITKIASKFNLPFNVIEEFNGIKVYNTSIKKETPIAIKWAEPVVTKPEEPVCVASVFSVEPIKEEKRIEPEVKIKPEAKQEQPKEIPVVKEEEPKVKKPAGRGRRS